MRRLLTAPVIEDQLVPMLADSASPDAATLIDRSWQVIEPLVRLNAEEAEYVTALGKGELRPELLAPEQPELASLLAAHPAIRWKVDNVRRHGAREQG